MAANIFSTSNLAGKSIIKLLKRISNVLFSTSSAGLYIILFAVSIGVATFIENDFGTSSAQKIIFKAWWFELILLLFGISLVANIIRFRMISNKKWATFTFHAAMIVILTGAGVTRYLGSEGIMHIREGSSSSTFLSSETYLQFEVTHQGRKYVFEEPVLFATLGDNNWKNSYIIGDNEVKIEVLNFMPNPTETMIEDDNGIPILKVVIGGINGREEYFVKYGERTNIHGTTFNFGNLEQGPSFNVKYENGKLYFKTSTTYTQMQMATQKRDTLLPGIYHPLLLRSLYSAGGQSFVIGDFEASGAVEIASSSNKMASNSLAGLELKITSDSKEETFLVYGRKGVEGRPRMVAIGKTSFGVSYGSKRVSIPFSIKLNDFIMERYPGTNSASSYASEVTLEVPQRNINRNQRIYMNHILNYGGYRFFQSSFDQDELGTYLSVNHDRWGSWLSYIGYALLTIGMILTMFNGNTRFRQLIKTIKKMRQGEKVLVSVCVGIFLSISIPASGAPSNELNIRAINLSHAKQFGQLVMQDHKGRLKPMNTFTSEVLRKISKKDAIYGLSSEQVLLGMATSPKEWYGVPIIKLGKHEEIRRILQTNDDLAAYRDFFEIRGEYKLRDLVRNAYNTPQRDRGALEKEILKLDEKVNICSMIFSGRFMKVFPIPNDLNHHWQSPADFSHQHDDGHNHQVNTSETYAEQFYPVYISTVQNAMDNGDWASANKLLAELNQFQETNGGDVLPTPSKLRAELLLNKLKIFNRLGKMYGLLGLIFLGLLFTSVFNPNINLKWPFRVTFGLFLFAFVMHTVGLGLRWFIAGRAPWSNGYESMIYIGFTTTLAGLIFSRKSTGGLAASCILSATILMVAGLSWLDPEITPLVPVLKSYWLTIHVSLEAGSYGFLMLGAIIGVVNLVLMIFGNKNNGKHTNRIIKEMTYVSEITLIGGLFMISIGTYLGGVWANESWGRYWGWDAKETWALVTILVYAFILHMRFIPGFRGVYAFNVASLFGWASVMMTYFGVNYYLSGLHSYAAGDPVPIPSFVYYTVIVLAIICLLAYWRQRQNSKSNLVKV